MPDLLTDTAVLECPRCGKPVTDPNAFTTMWYDALFRLCSEPCRTVWRGILIGQRNCTESYYGGVR